MDDLRGIPIYGSPHIAILNDTKLPNDTKRSAMLICRGVATGPGILSPGHAAQGYAAMFYSSCVILACASRSARQTAMGQNDGLAPLDG